MIWRKVSCKWDAVQWLCRIFDPWGLMQMATAWGGILIRSQKCLSKEPKSHPLAEVQVVSKQGHHKRKGVMRNLGPGTSQLTPHRIWGLKLSFKILNRKKKSDRLSPLHKLPATDELLEGAVILLKYAMVKLCTDHIRKTRTNFFCVLALKWWQYFFLLKLSLAGNTFFYSKVLSWGSSQLQ